MKPPNFQFYGPQKDDLLFWAFVCLLLAACAVVIVVRNWS